jgi:hypothetical protein
MEKSRVRIGVQNLMRNWYVPVSALGFYYLQDEISISYLFGVLIVMLLVSQKTSVWKSIQENPTSIKIISILSALGVSGAGYIFFRERRSGSTRIHLLESMLPISVDLVEIIGLLCVVVSFFFIYCGILLVYQSFISIMKEGQILHDINRSEGIIYMVLLIVALAFMAIIFLQTDVFYGTNYSYDIIYTSDSPMLVKGNVYLRLMHGENDLRQPLFAVFAAPFLGIPYLFVRLFSVSTSVAAILSNSIQMLMLFTANYLLIKILRLDSTKRIAFMILNSSMYTYLLSVLMMEQYVVGYFWLVLCVYLIAEKGRVSRIAMWGAGGTLLTSLVLMPSLSDKSPLRNFKGWICDMIRYGIEFVGLMLLFCRYDVIRNLSSKIRQLRTFTGENLTFTQKFYQYTEFVKNCFVSPSAGIRYTSNPDFATWQLDEVTTVNWVGILLLVLCVISAVLNHKKKSGQLAAIWVGFSVVMLLFLGWGTRENGLILYALYFAWAFLLLLYLLVEYIAVKCKMAFLTPLVCGLGAIGMFAINLPAIFEMVRFATTYFPI